MSRRWEWFIKQSNNYAIVRELASVITIITIGRSGTRLYAEYHVEPVYWMYTECILNGI